MADSLAYTAEEAAQVIGVSESTLRRLAKRGEGPPRLTLGRRVLFPKAAVHRWLDEQATAISIGGAS